MVRLPPLAFSHPDFRQILDKVTDLSSWIDEGQALDGADFILAEGNHGLTER
jgi:hypothetical protein